MNHYSAWGNMKRSHPSDIPDWEEKDGETDTPSRWRYGNTKRCREVVSNFAKSSSVHGAAYVCSSGRKSASLCVKIIYRIIFTICFLAVISSIVSLLQDNFSKQSTFINTINRDVETGYEEDPEYFPLYPRITICRRPPYRTVFNESQHLKLVEYVMLSLGYPFTPLTLSDQTMAVELVRHQMQMVDNLSAPAVHFRKRLEHLEKRYKALKEAGHFDLRQFVDKHSLNCSEFFSSCVVLVFTVDCCSLFQPVLTTDGRCFTIRDTSSIVEYVRGSPVRFSVKVDLTTPPKLEQRSEAGFRMYLTDPSEEVPVFFGDLDGQDIVPGHATTIKASLIKIQRVALHTPLHSMWNNCPKWRYNASYESDRYSYVACKVRFYEHTLREKCGCKTLLHGSSGFVFCQQKIHMGQSSVANEEACYHDLLCPARISHVGPSTLKLCEPKDMYQCYIRIALEKKKNLTDLVTNCDQPCIVYSYKTKSSYMSLGRDENVSRVEIVYNVKQYTYNEYMKATLSSLFSQIGGSLGLYLGASIITLVEILTFTATWLWYRLVPTKVNNAPAKGPTRHHTPVFTLNSRPY